jgi:hypothetical protein
MDFNKILLEEEEEEDYTKNFWTDLIYFHIGPVNLYFLWISDWTSLSFLKS